jgi:signal transduction histidine kinase
LQRRLEQELQRAQRLELVGRLASGTVHDFNNLLTVMTGLTSLVSSGLAADHPSQQELQQVLEAGEQAMSLAGQLLTFSKQRTTVMRPVDLNVVAAQVLKLLLPVMPAGVRLESSLAKDSMVVAADDNQLKQVLMNLCLNARDAMPAGGRLTVQIEEIPVGSPGAPTVFEGARAAASWARITVQDTGTGMSEEVQSRIFEPFFSTKERGTGLGLAVVRQIVESHGGRVQLQSKPGEGTRFEIWLPMARG